MTKTRGRIFTYMLVYQRKYGRSPTTREIAKHIRKSVGTTHYHLYCMKQMGIVSMRSPRRMWAQERHDTYYAEE